MIDALPRGLSLLSSMATRELLQVLLKQFEREYGVHVEAGADGGVRVAARIRSGEAIDVVVLALESIDELIAEGWLVGGSRTALVRSGIAIAVPSGTPHPDVSSSAALRETVLAAPSIGYSTGPSGRHLERVFERWGVLERIRPRIRVAPAGVPVGSLISGGQVRLGFQQLSELMGFAGVDLLGPLPADIQVVTTFAGAISTASTRPDPAGQLLRYLASPAHADVHRQFGMEP